ncbi:hypothetical protein D9619_009082 [Psilocybe cf. subviscida]|uniref:Uncharacterized protein n=1 Tax=Psilocybe cf. subviscida TaxID=2480587 RepID=A0A8H5BUI6_9AGAR|nr:hypothetical protein D9619_009082 [Psilocybe cf. subviscida]
MCRFLSGAIPMYCRKAMQNLKLLQRDALSIRTKRRLNEHLTTVIEKKAPFPPPPPLWRHTRHLARFKPTSLLDCTSRAESGHGLDISITCDVTQILEEGGAQRTQQDEIQVAGYIQGLLRFRRDS